MALLQGVHDHLYSAATSCAWYTPQHYECRSVRCLSSPSLSSPLAVYCALLACLLCAFKRRYGISFAPHANELTAGTGHFTVAGDLCRCVPALTAYVQLDPAWL